MTEPPRLDGLLAGYLAAAEGADAEERLGRLLAEEAAPLVDRIVRAQLAGVDGADLEDVCAGTLLRLTERLRELRGEEPGAIASFEGYVVAVARNGCRAYLRALRPEWTRLSNQIRYLVGHDPAFATWRGADGRRLAGLAAWRGRPAADVDLLDPARLEAAGLPARAELAPLLRRLLLAAGGPVPMSGLVGTVARLRSLEEVRSVPLGGDGEEAGVVDLPSNATGPEQELLDRRFLAWVWREVGELPVGQRRALLLNLRDPRGGDLLSLMPTAGIAPVAAIARLLELATAELEALWERLPLEDREIGERFELSQRQVVNLRKSARERLGRRLRRQEAGEGR